MLAPAPPLAAVDTNGPPQPVHALWGGTMSAPINPIEPHSLPSPGVTVRLHLGRADPVEAWRQFSPRLPGQWSWTTAGGVLAADDPRIEGWS